MTSEDSLFRNAVGDAGIAGDCSTISGVAELADASDALLRKLDLALPLRSEHARATAFALVAFCQNMGRDPEGLTLRELFHLASATTMAAMDVADAWFAIGKMDGAWYAVGRANRLNPSPLILLDRGRRRRLLDAMLFAGARAFHSEEDARVAGRGVFERTYVRHVSRTSAVSTSSPNSLPA